MLAQFASFLTTVYVLYKFAEGGRRFSVILTVGAILQCLAWVILSLKVSYQKTVSGLSSRMLESYVVFFCFRLGSTLIKDGYLPSDRSGDYLYQSFDIASLVLVLNLLYSVHRRFPDTYQAEHDSLQIIKALPACILLSCLLHGDLNNSMFFDTIWTVSMWVDTISLLPQLFLLSKLGGQVETLTSHFVAALVLSRGASFAFWFYGFKEVGRVSGSAAAGYAVLAAHLVQLLLCADFMYYYVKGMVQKGRQVVLPTVGAEDGTWTL